MERGKVGLVELVILAIIGVLVYIVIERQTRSVEPPAAVAKVPEPEKTPKAEVAPLPAPEVAPLAPEAPHPAPTLDEAAIKVGLDGVAFTVEACGDRLDGECGKATLHIGVAPDGSVTYADVETTTKSTLGKCVAAAVRKATFQATAQGGDFEYPFEFGCGD